jgi:hypothetical protein
MRGSWGVMNWAGPRSVNQSIKVLLTYCSITSIVMAMTSPCIRPECRSTDPWSISNDMHSGRMPKYNRRNISDGIWIYIDKFDELVGLLRDQESHKSIASFKPTSYNHVSEQSNSNPLLQEVALSEPTKASNTIRTVIYVALSPAKFASRNSHTNTNVHLTPRQKSVSDREEPRRVGVRG